MTDREEEERWRPRETGARLLRRFRVPTASGRTWKVLRKEKTR